jgi:acetyl-CoA carboxylase/biotin carboxylase 1
MRHTGAVVLGFQESIQASEAFVDMLAKGQIPPESALTSSTQIEIIYENVKYVYQCALSAPNSMTLQCNNTYAQADVRPLSDGGFLVTVKGRNRYGRNRNPVNTIKFTLV